MSVHPGPMNPSKPASASGPPSAGAGAKKIRRAPLVPKDETPDQTLKRLARRRVTEAIKRIRLVGNLSSYRPTEEQAKLILKALDDEMNAVERRLLQQPGVKQDAAFSLS